MPCLPRNPELLQLIEAAMKQRAPEIYRSLKEDGVLHRVLRDRAKHAAETYSNLWNEAALHAASANRSLSAWDRVQEATQAQSRAARLAIDQSVEFDDMNPID